MKTASRLQTMTLAAASAVLLALPAQAVQSTRVVACAQQTTP